MRLQLAAGVLGGRGQVGSAAAEALTVRRIWDTGYSALRRGARFRFAIVFAIA